MNISFVIPAYNEEAYLGRCLDAILRDIAAQKSEADFEIIIVDNNSNDRTCDIVEEYSAKYPFVMLIHEPERGANRARETGFKTSKGELVAFLDADTEIQPGWIARAERAFAENPKLVCLSGPFIYYDLPLTIRAFVKIFYAISYLVYIVNNFILHNTSVIQGGSEIVRRDALEKIGGHDVSITFYGDDADLAKRLSKVGEVKFSLGFPILSSGRRLAKEGTFTMGLRYMVNYFWVTFFGKPFTTISTEARFKDEQTVYKPESKTRELLSAGVFAVLFILVLLIAIFVAYLIVSGKIW